MLKSFSILSSLDTFEERYRYLRIGGVVGKATFGYDRPLNQRFYRSTEWRRLRDEILIRDNGCDLGVPGRDIFSRPLIHHMNPLSPEQVQNGGAELFDPENLITVSHMTHNAIHYGDETLLDIGLNERLPGDTTPWAKR